MLVFLRIKYLENALTKYKKLFMHQVHVAFSLVIITSCSSTFPSTRAELDLKTAFAPIQETHNQLETVMGRTLTEQDMRLIAANRWLSLAWKALSEKDYALARSLSLAMLDSQDFSITQYRWAFASLAMATISLANQGTWKSQAEALQSLIADTKLTPGMQALSDFEKVDSLERFNSQFVAGTLAKLAKFELPLWWHIFDTQKPEKSAASTTDLTPLQEMKKLTREGKWDKAASLARIQLQKTNIDCGSSQYAYFVQAQAERKGQNRRAFFERQKDLIAAMDKTPCSAKDFDFSAREYDEFSIDNRLWLARLLWERGENEQALLVAENEFEKSTKLGLSTLAFEAAHVIVGRAGFESKTPQENLARINSMSQKSVFSKRARRWLSERRAFFQLLAGDYEQAADSFTQLADESSDNSDRAEALYWKGRALQAGQLEKESTQAFVESGITDPLSYYDILSGQALQNSSNRASTTKTRAFAGQWQPIHERKIAITAHNTFSLFAPPDHFLEDDAVENSGKDFYEKKWDKTPPTSLSRTLLSAQLGIATLRINQSEVPFEDFQNGIRYSEGFFETLARAEARSLKKQFEKELSNNESAIEISQTVAWILHLTQNDAETILFVGKLRDKFSFHTSKREFLYLLFYPKPYSQSYEDAAQKCNVDVNLLYAISRQESLFQKDVKSGAGAIGLMQLLPSTAKRILSRFPEYQVFRKEDLQRPEVNTLAGACYLSDLLSHYEGNLVYTIAAYNAGEAAVDTWRQRRGNVTKDLNVFVEFIPFGETQKYVERVLRNYYNMHWIYGTSTPTNGARYLK